MRFTTCPPFVHLSVHLPDFRLTTVSFQPSIILAFSIKLTLFVHLPDHLPDGLSPCPSLSVCLSTCSSQIASLFDGLRDAHSPAVPVAPWVPLLAPLPSPAPSLTHSPVGPPDLATVSWPWTASRTRSSGMGSPAQLRFHGTPGSRARTTRQAGAGLLLSCADGPGRARGRRGRQGKGCADAFC